MSKELYSVHHCALKSDILKEGQLNNYKVLKLFYHYGIKCNVITKKKTAIYRSSQLKSRVGWNPNLNGAVLAVLTGAVKSLSAREAAGEAFGIIELPGKCGGTLR